MFSYFLKTIFLICNRYDQIQNAVSYCTQIVNNNVMGDERVGELLNDEPFEHELTDSDDMYDDDDNNVDNAPNASVEDQSINYHSTAIPYLDTLKNMQKILSTREMTVPFERHFGIQTILNISNRVRLLKTKYFIVVYLFIYLFHVD